MAEPTSLSVLYGLRLIPDSFVLPGFAWRLGDGLHVHGPTLCEQSEAGEKAVLDWLGSLSVVRVTITL